LLMGMKNLRERLPNSVPEDVELFEQNGEVYGVQTRPDARQ